MAKVLSMEIGASLIRICEVDYKQKNPKVYNRAIIQTPQGALKDDVVVVDDELVSAIKKALSDNHIRTKKMVFVLNSPKIASREVMIPYVKENRIGDVVRANASDYFPVDLEQYELAHSLIGVAENEKGVKLYKILVLAAPKAITSSYFELASALGGSVEALDYGGNSMYQMIRSQCSTGVQMVVKVDEKASLITVLQDQVIILQRTIAYGIDDAIAVLTNSSYHRNLTYGQAMGILRAQNYFEEEFDANKDEFPDRDGEHITSRTGHEEVKASLDYLVNGISRVVDYYNSRNNGVVIEKVYVTGLGGDCKGIDEFLSKSLGIYTQVLRELEGFRLDKSFKDESFGPYLTCIGAAIAPLGFMGELAEKGKKLELLPQKGGGKDLSMLVFVGGILIAVVLAVTSYIGLANVRKQNNQLKARVEELEPVKQLYKDYLQQQYTHTKLNYLYDSTILPGENLVEFIEEMEKKMPASLNVQTFVASNEGVTMTLTVKDKKDAAKLIQQFRTFESVSAVSVSGISDSGAVMEGEPIEQEGMVTFSVTIMYKGADEDVAEEVEQQAAEETEQQAEEEQGE